MSGRVNDNPLKNHRCEQCNNCVYSEHKKTMVCTATYLVSCSEISCCLYFNRR